MKLLTYIWRNVKRNKLRSCLTILSVGFCLSLMTMLYGYLAMQNVVERDAADSGRLAVLNKLGFAGIVPIAHVERVRKMPAVAAAIPFSWFGGSYKNQQMPFAQFGTDPEYAFDVFDDYTIPEDQLAAFKDDQQGCVADKVLAEQMGWKLGDRIPLEGTIYPFNLDLRLVGIYEADANTGSIMFNWYYLDEEAKKTAATYAGNAGMIYVKCKVSDEVALSAMRLTPHLRIPRTQLEPGPRPLLHVCSLTCLATSKRTFASFRLRSYSRWPWSLLRRWQCRCANGRPKWRCSRQSDSPS